MDSNETNRPLTEVPMDKTPETLVSSPAQAEENNTMYVPKQTKEEVTVPKQSCPNTKTDTTS